MSLAFKENTFELPNIVQIHCPKCQLPARGVVRPGGWLHYDCLYCGKAGRVNERDGEVEDMELVV